jgi:transposase
MPEPTSCCRVGGGYCDRCDLLVGLEGLHVMGWIATTAAR